MDGEMSDGNFESRLPATLVISVWRELESPHSFRARIFSDHGVSAEPSIQYAIDAEGVVAAVREWLGELPAV